MFSTMPRIGTVRRLNIASAFVTSRSDDLLGRRDEDARR